MLECWQRDENERPSFREIHLFLQRKNLGYNPLVSDDGGIHDDVEESYGDETSVTETDDDLFSPILQQQIQLNESRQQHCLCSFYCYISLDKLILII